MRYLAPGDQPGIIRHRDRAVPAADQAAGPPPLVLPGGAPGEIEEELAFPACNLAVHVHRADEDHRKGIVCLLYTSDAADE